MADLGLLPVVTRFALAKTLRRRAYLAETSRAAGGDFVPAADTCFAAARQAQFEALADAIGAHLDTGALLRLIARGPPPGPPILRPGW